jgi:hypothetical protein
MVIYNEELLRTSAPAIFSQSHRELSSRYEFLPTTEVIEVLQEEGWRAYNAQQVNPRKWTREHAKHIIRFRKEGEMSALNVGQTIPELLLMNSHNGTAGYRLHGGIFRLVCSNGLVISDVDYGTIHIRHRKGEMMKDQLIAASRNISKSTAKAAEVMDEWQTINLTERQAKDYASDAAKIRWKDGADDGLIQNLLNVRRVEDQNKDLWTTFNVVQENLLRGGFVNDRTRRQVRAINNIQKDVDYNSQLWELTSTYGKELALN